MPSSLSVSKVLAIAVLAAAVVVGGCARQQQGTDASSGLSLGAATPGSVQDFQSNVGDRVFFETESSALTATATATLNRQIQWLTQHARYTFTVEGHADERGTREYNLALGARRATAVRDYMIAHGIAANRIRTVSFGKERPVAVCDNITCWSQNRRAVTVLGGTSEPSEIARFFAAGPH